MRKLYLKVGDSGERINIDVYPPAAPAPSGGFATRPVVIVACGGAGKDLRLGKSLVGKFAASYHDIGEWLAGAGFWAIIPSRRGDPQRTNEARTKLADTFRDRLPAELLKDEGPNEGAYSHRNHEAELTWLIENLAAVVDLGVDNRRLGILGDSAGGGVALAAAAKLGERVASIALWGSALKTSQWFVGPKADSFFEEILIKPGIRYARQEFLREMCDAVDFVGRIEVPIMFACAVTDPYAPSPSSSDKWSDVNQQLELMRYAIRCRYSKAAAVKGAEHTMYAEQSAWTAYASTITEWFGETLHDDERPPR